MKCVEQRFCTRVLKLLLQSNKSHFIVFARFDTSYADWLPSYLLLLYPRSIVYSRAHPIEGRGPLSVRKRQFISHHCFSHHRTFVFFVVARCGRNTTFDGYASASKLCNLLFFSLVDSADVASGIDSLIPPRFRMSSQSGAVEQLS